MRADFESNLNALVDASGGRIWIVDGDRDNGTQTKLWANAVAKYGIDEAPNWVARPGNSNHEKGIAADLGGDLRLAAQLAPQFGLYFPMGHEPWHVEPIGSRSDASPNAYTPAPIGTTATPQPQSYGDILASMIGGPSYSDIFSTPTDPAFQNRISTVRPTLHPNRANAPVFTSPNGGPTGIDGFMNALRDVESSGNYQAVGVETDWGRASGAYQFLDSTWGGYEGYSRAADAPPAVQDRRARELMQQYYNQYGSWDSVAAAWYSGPGGNWESNEVQTYIQKVNARL